MAYVLMVDDDSDLCLLVGRQLHGRGHTVETASSGEAALAAARERRPDIILLDFHLGGMDGLETLKRLRLAAPGVPVVMVTAYADLHTAVCAMKEGATDFLTKPFDHRALGDAVDRLLARDRGVPSAERGAREGAAPALIGESVALRGALDTALKFAVPDINVMLLGETGTGKELFARTIHAASKRKDGPFVAIDCSMLTETLIEAELFGHEKGSFTGATTTRAGRLEMAQGGTLFLDEIGNLPMSFQAKLLRVLQERKLERVGGRETIKLDVRVISATNADLKRAIRDGTFRQDLYYRLGEMVIHLPPLRDRKGDVAKIAEYFVGMYSNRFSKRVVGLSDCAVELLSAYPWPGNVRELENAIKRAVVLADTHVRAEHLPQDLHEPPPDSTPVVEVSGERLDDDRLHVELDVDIGIGSRNVDLKAFSAEAAEQAERSLLSTLLRRSHMSCAQMARMLSVDPKTLRAKLRKYRLEMV